MITTWRNSWLSHLLIHLKAVIANPLHVVMDVHILILWCYLTKKNRPCSGDWKSKWDAVLDCQDRSSVAMRVLTKCTRGSHWGRGGVATAEGGVMGFKTEEGPQAQTAGASVGRKGGETPAPQSLQEGQPWPPLDESPKRLSSDFCPNTILLS